MLYILTEYLFERKEKSCSKAEMSPYRLSYSLFFPLYSAHSSHLIRSFM